MCFRARRVRSRHVPETFFERAPIFSFFLGSCPCDSPIRKVQTWLSILRQSINVTYPCAGTSHSIRLAASSVSSCPFVFPHGFTPSQPGYCKEARECLHDEQLGRIYRCTSFGK